MGPKVTCLIAIFLANIWVPSIYAYSHPYVGPTIAQHSKAEGPIQNQVYSNNADIVKSTYGSNAASAAISIGETGSLLQQQPHRNVYQKSPYFTNVVNSQPTPFHSQNHNHNHNGFKLNGVFYTTANNNDNNNAILANQQITNAPTVSNFNNAVVSNQQSYNAADVYSRALLHNQNANLNIQNNFYQNVLEQLNNKNNALKNQISNNPYLYNHPLLNNPFAQNSFSNHPALGQNQISNQRTIPTLQSPRFFNSQYPNQQGAIQNQISNQEAIQHPEFFNEQGIVPNPFSNQIIDPTQTPNQGQAHFQPQINNQEIFQNLAKTQPILKYSIPSPYFNHNGLESPQPQFGNPGVNPEQQNPFSNQPPPPQFPPQSQSHNLPAPNDINFQHPAYYQPIHNNSLPQPLPVSGPPVIPGAILGRTKETPTRQQNNVEPLQTLSSQEISDAEFFSKREPPIFPPLMDQGERDNVEFLRRGLTPRNAQPVQVKHEPLVQHPDVPPGCAFNADGGENCIEIK